MGWKEFLEDYEKEEIEYLDEFSKKAHDTSLSSFEMFPPAIRYPNFHQPASRLLRMWPRARLWSGILLSGTTLVPLLPMPKSFFEKHHGFAIREIPKIIDFAKRTGKIAFYLREPPTAYKDVKFLEPILTALRPPLSIDLSPSVFFSPKEVERYYIEFGTLASFSLRSYIEQNRPLTGLRSSLKEVESNLFGIYAFLKGLGYQNIVDRIGDCIISDPETTVDIMTMADELIVKPFRDVSASSFIFDKDRYIMRRRFAESHMLNLRKPQFPGEIGKFLTHTLVHSPPSLEACEQLYYHYKDQDVYKVAQALNEGITASDPDIIDKSSSELSTIMNNIWETKNLRKRTLGVRFGTHALLGVVGPVATLLTGGLGGLLIGLGVEVGNAFLTMKPEIAERIAKRLSQNYETIVYDFKRRYKLDTPVRELGK